MSSSPMLTSAHHVIVVHPKAMSAAMIYRLRDELAIIGSLPSQEVSAALMSIAWILMLIGVITSLCLRRSLLALGCLLFLLAVLRICAFSLRAYMAFREKWHPTQLAVMTAFMDFGVVVEVAALVLVVHHALKPYRPQRGFLRFLLGHVNRVMYLPLFACVLLAWVGAKRMLPIVLVANDPLTPHQHIARAVAVVLLVVIGVQIELLAMMWHLQRSRRQEHGPVLAALESSKLTYVSILTGMTTWLVVYTTVCFYNPHTWLSTGTAFYAFFNTVDLSLAALYCSVRWRSLLLPLPPCNLAGVRLAGTSGSGGATGGDGSGAAMAATMTTLYPHRPTRPSTEWQVGVAPAAPHVGAGVEYAPEVSSQDTVVAAVPLGLEKVPKGGDGSLDEEERGYCFAVANSAPLAGARGRQVTGGDALATRRVPATAGASVVVVESEEDPAAVAAAAAAAPVHGLEPASGRGFVRPLHSSPPGPAGGLVIDVPPPPPRSPPRFHPKKLLLSPRPRSMPADH